MQIKFRLTVMNFLQFFVWGAWLISMGTYAGQTLKFSGGEIGSIYATMGIASLFMPGLMGIIADRWVNAERLYGICHLIGAGLLFWAATVKDYDTLYWILLLNSMFYMPTIALNNTVSYEVLEQNGFEIVKTFPPIRVWGTIGFIAAMWATDLANWTLTSNQLFLASGAALLLGLYAFSMPKCPPAKNKSNNGIIESLGLNAFVLFRKRQMAIFFVFAMLLGAALQITNAFGGDFLRDFKKTYPGTFGVEHPNLLISLSQISETLFILTIPFFLRRFGIKKVMLMSIFAWVFRFGLFAIGNPGGGLGLLILSMIVYGMAFDFFNISGSLFVEKEADVNIRASAQGLFMIMTNGLGAFLGGMISGKVVDHFTTVVDASKNESVKNWPAIWFCFAVYSLLLGLIFPFVFNYKHDAKDIGGVKSH